MSSTSLFRSLISVPSSSIVLNPVAHQRSQEAAGVEYEFESDKTDASETLGDLLMEIDEPTTSSNAIFDCPKCTATFRTKQCLLDHKKEKHNDDTIPVTPAKVKKTRGRPRKIDSSEPENKKKLNEIAKKENNQSKAEKVIKSRKLRNLLNNSPVEKPKRKSNGALTHKCQHCSRVFATVRAKLMHISWTHRQSTKLRTNRFTRNYAPSSSESESEASSESESSSDNETDNESEEKSGSEEESGSESESSNDAEVENGKKSESEADESLANLKRKRDSLASTTSENLPLNTLVSKSDVICEFCFRTFESLKSKNIHIGHKHATEKEPTSKPPTPQPQTSNKPDPPQTSKLTKAVMETSETRFKCSDCPMTFFTEYGLTKHQQWKHPKNRKRLKKKIRRSSSDATARVFKCKKCPKKFPSEQHLMSHDQIRHQNNGHEVKRVRNKSTNVTTYKCCSLVFDSLRSLRVHTSCTNSFKVKAKMEKIKSIVHPNSTAGKFKCKVCNLEYISPDNLLRHYKKVHEDNRPTFKCNVCGGMFQAQRALVGHQKIKHNMNVN